MTPMRDGRATMRGRAYRWIRPPTDLRCLDASARAQVVVALSRDALPGRRPEPVHFARTSARGPSNYAHGKQERADVPRYSEFTGFRPQSLASSAPQVARRIDGSLTEG